MKKLLTLKNLMFISGYSEVALRRKTADARKGVGDLPVPISKPGQKLLWNPDDIAQWMGCRLQPTPVRNIETPTQRSKRHAAAMKSLADKGVTLPSQK